MKAISLKNLSVCLTFLVLVSMAVFSGFGQKSETPVSAAAMDSNQPVAEPGPNEEINNDELLGGTAWLVNTALPEAIGQTTTATVGGKIYIIGGGFGPTLIPRNTLWEYDPTDTNYTMRANLPVAIRAFGAAAVYNGRIFVFGGFDGSSPRDILQIYNTADNTWSMGAAMPGPRFGPAVAAIGQFIYVAGGASDVANNTLWRYDAELNTYTTLASMPADLFRIHGAPYVAETDGVSEIHIFAGGFDGQNHLVYDVITNVWRGAPGMPFGVTDPATVRRGDRIYVLGGLGNGRCQIFNVPAGTWSQGPIIPGAIDNTSGDLFDGTGPGGIVYLFGGFNGSDIHGQSYALHIQFQ